MRDQVTDGILNVNKPRGKTSFQIVAEIRRLSGERRVGHSGTLDPEATGVLPILLGQGTRIAEFLFEAKKIYRAEIEFGIVTDTYDAGGRIIRRGDTSSLNRERLEAALSSFQGTIEQIPPMYSAVKHNGKPLYRLARAGIEISRKPRKVEIFRLEVLDWQNPLLTIEVECSKGTYIRSLAYDLGQALGCGAYLKDLTRLQSGPFHINQSVSLSQLEEAFQQGYWKNFLYPLDWVLSHLKAVILDEASEKAILNGRPLSLPSKEMIAEERCRAYSLNGRLLAILRFEPRAKLWRPEKVLGSRELRN